VTVEVDGTLDEAHTKLLPGLRTDFARKGERVMVNPVLVTHARARRDSAPLPDAPSGRESYMRSGRNA
jgi:hypothetical protein